MGSVSANHEVEVDLDFGVSMMILLERVIGRGVLSVVGLDSRHLLKPG